MSAAVGSPHGQATERGKTASSEGGVEVILRRAGVPNVLGAEGDIVACAQNGMLRCTFWPRTVTESEDSRNGDTAVMRADAHLVAAGEQNITLFLAAETVVVVVTVHDRAGITDGRGGVGRKLSVGLIVHADNAAEIDVIGTHVDKLQLRDLLL